LQLVKNADSWPSTTPIGGANLWLASVACSEFLFAIWNCEQPTDSRVGLETGGASSDAFLAGLMSAITFAFAPGKALSADGLPFATAFM
jgi:hypothetical protein